MSTELNTFYDKASLFAPENIQHALKVANLICQTEMTPRAYKGKPNDVLIAMELGRTWNLSPLQAIQNIAVINGKPCAYGDLVLAICSSHPDFENIEEEPIIKNGATVGYTCTIKRKGWSAVTQSFTVEQAKAAGLWGRQGPWSQYPSRMLQMRARGFALRDSFADALNGVAIREEVEDYPVKDVTQRNDKVSSLADKLKSAKSKKHDTQIQEVETVNVDDKQEDEETKKNDEETEKKVNHDTLKKVHELAHEKDFNNGRLLKALEHYGVEYMGELTQSQANDFINHLNKLESK